MSERVSERVDEWVSGWVSESASVWQGRGSQEGSEPTFRCDTGIKSHPRWDKKWTMPDRTEIAGVP